MINIYTLSGFQNFYKKPMGVIKSMLLKSGIEFEIEDLIENDLNVKVIRSKLGYFFFRRAGKHNSWLCYKIV